MAYPIAKYIVPPIYRLWIRKVEGMENIPKDKPFIIAANHTSYFDALLLPSIVVPILNKRMKALVNSHYWRLFITRLFLDLWGGIPVYVGKERDAKEKNKESLKKVLEAIKKNEILMIFPEGKRSPDGKLLKPYTGVAKLALKAKVSVLPCGIIDSNKVLPRGAFLPRLARCQVRIGKLMKFDKYYNKKPNEKIYQQITRRIMKQIAKLIGQEYNY